MNHLARIGRAYWREILLATTVLVGMRIVSLTASCWLDASQICRDWFFYGTFGPLRFQWVAKYKELLAGILAAAAGAFILLATRMQIAEQRDRSARDERRRVIGLIHRLEMDLFRAANAIAYDGPMDRFNFDDSRAATAEISAISVQKAGFLDIAHFIARTEAGKVPHRSSERRIAALYAVVGHVVCSRIRDNITDDKPFTDGPLRAPIIVDIARRVRVTADELKQLRVYCDVDWTLAEMAKPSSDN